MNKERCITVKVIFNYKNYLITNLTANPVLYILYIFFPVLIADTSGRTSFFPMPDESTAMYFTFLLKEVFTLQIVIIIALFIAFYIGWKGRSKIRETSMYHISDLKFSVVSQKHSAWFDWSCFSKAVFKKSFVILKLPTFRAYTILFDDLDQVQIREIKKIITSKIKKISGK